MHRRGPSRHGWSKRPSGTYASVPKVPSTPVPMISRESLAVARTCERSSTRNRRTASRSRWTLPMLSTSSRRERGLNAKERSSTKQVGILRRRFTNRPTILISQSPSPSPRRAPSSPGNWQGWNTPSSRPPTRRRGQERLASAAVAGQPPAIPPASHVP